jgi:hypothetical protein
MVEASPFPDQATARKCELLDDPADDPAAPAAADAREIPRPHFVARDEGRVLRRDHELVQVTVEAARSREAGKLAVGRVDDDPLAGAETVHGFALPPRQDRRAAEGLDLEVGHGLVRDRMEPDELAVVVDDHGAALPRPGGRCEEHEPPRGSAGGVEHLDRRRLQVGT